MNKIYKIIFNQKSCINANKCIGIHPEQWEKDKSGNTQLSDGAINPQTGHVELLIPAEKLDAYKESALICPAYVIDIVDPESGKSVLKIQPTKAEDKDKVPVILAHYDSMKEWRMDPKGFFTIKPFFEEQVIRVRYYGEDHALKFLIEGDNGEKIYNTIVREGMVSTLQHAAYLGYELTKAEIAMKKNLPYIQDDPLEF